MYVTENDYVVIGPDSLTILQKSDATRREVAEQAAAQEIRGYLGSRYDLDAEYLRTDYTRNMKLVQVFCDLVLYALVCSLPQRMGYELRKQRYDDAMKWLQSARNMNLELPTFTDGTDSDSGNPLKFGSMEKLTNDW